MPRPYIRPTVPRFSSTVRVAAALLFAAPAAATAQGTLADYERADSFAARTRGLVVDVAGAPSWIGDTGRLWYRKSVEGGNRFVLVDPSSASKAPTFDHERLARSPRPRATPSQP